MRIIRFLYYLCTFILSFAAILFWVIVQPFGLFFVIPMVLFLFCFPTIRNKSIKRKLNLDCSDTEVSDKLIQLKTELDEREEKVCEVESIINTIEMEHKKELDVYKNKLIFSEKILKVLVPTMSGEIYERYVGYKLQNLGYKDINYTPFSKDFGADIIAINPNEKRVCIQCKRYENTVGIDAVQEISSAKQYYDCDVAMVVTNSAFTSSAKELAKKVRVVLWENFV